MYTFILDPSFHSTMPVFCFCNAEDGEKTSILGFEKGTKNKELIHYKITVNGPLKVTHPSVQFDAVKSEMRFLAENGEVSITRKLLVVVSVSRFMKSTFNISLQFEHSLPMRLTEEST